MAIILHLALLVTIGVAELEVSVTLQNWKQVAQKVEAQASADEMETLRTLLMARSKWHPNAPELLRNVLSRPSGMHGRKLAASCRDSKSMVTCTQMADPETSCNACKWSSSMSSCQTNSCTDYEDQTACCANARNVKKGCYWNPHAKKNLFGSSTSAKGKCVTLNDCGEMAEGKCSSSFGMDATSCPEAQSVCEGITGCKWNSCGGCQSTGTTCQCQGGSASCTSGSSDGGALAGGIMALATGNTGCGLTDCVLCMKNDDSGNMDRVTQSCDTIAARRSGRCSSKCSKVVHNAAEAKCLGRNNDLCNQTVAQCTGKVTPPPKSCVATTVASSTPTCAAQCKAFDAMCESSGTKSDCTVPYANAATSTLLGLVVGMLVMIVSATR